MGYLRSHYRAFKNICTLLSVALVLNMLLVIPVFGADDADKGRRSVYIHANKAETKETSNVSEVYLGDETDIFLDIDKPNKGETEEEAHYNLAGYTVKFYYDGAYFAPIDPQSPLDYKYPFTAVETGGQGDIGDDGIVDDEELPEIVPGLYVHAYGAGEEVIDGKTWQTAYATILISGTNEKFPDKDVDWYSLCRLQLKPLQTGTTEVFIELDTSTEENFGLELLAKNNSAPDFRPTFETDVINGGYHQIIIKNKSLPNVPVPDVQPGSYPSAQTVTLSADSDSEIYYTLDSSVPAIPDESAYNIFDPENPIQIEKTTIIQCYAKRISDGRTSQVVFYSYVITPQTPTLYFKQGGTADDKVPNYYLTDEPISVWASDSAQGDQNITDENEIYYTFSNLSADKCTAENIGEDPETQWVKVVKSLRRIDLDQSRTLRLMTVCGEEKSDVETYYIVFQPKAPTADPSGGNDQRFYQVHLYTESEGAAIYYSLDGTDPRTNGKQYSDAPITITESAVLRAVAKRGDAYSDISVFSYTVIPSEEPIVSAFETPGVYTEKAKVTLFSSNYDDTIYYTLDGSEPTENSPVFQPGTMLELTEYTMIKTFAKSENGTIGQTMTYSYSIKPESPQIIPQTTQFANAGTVTIYAPLSEENAEMYYTLDGTDPTNSETRIRAESTSVDIFISDDTTISAVIVKDEHIFSDVAVERYSAVYARPTKPNTTLQSGIHIYSCQQTEAYTTQFYSVSNGTKIYYSIGSKGGKNYPPADPTLGLETTQAYTAGDEIPLQGETIIKAVAIDAQGQKSDIGIFYYHIVPETPIAPSNTVMTDTTLYLPVSAPRESTVSYTINDVQNTVFMDELDQFFLDPKTGLAYRDQNLTEKIGTMQEEITITFPFTLVLTSEKDGVVSAEGRYTYTFSDMDILPAPYADKMSGTYDEAVLDTEGNFLEVHLYTPTVGAQIEYIDGKSMEWKVYDDPVKINSDTVLYTRAVKNGQVSVTKAYVYYFSLLQPVITLQSGIYTGTQSASIELNPNVPSTGGYQIFYRINGDTSDVRYTGQPIQVEKTMSLRAYVVKNYGTSEVETSACAFASYIIVSGSDDDGGVYIAAPFDQRTRYSIHEIAQAPYANGIQLLSSNPAMRMMYYYSYTLRDSGQVFTSAISEYTHSPILVTPAMRDLHITAWLVGEDSTATEQQVFSYYFYDIGMPETDLPAVDESNIAIEYASGTEFTLISAYSTDENVLIYYTLDGSDPTDNENTERILFTGEAVKITKDLMLRAVYYNKCGACAGCMAEPQTTCSNAFYGPIAEWTYEVRKPTMVIGGGGGSGGSRPNASPTPAPTAENMLGVTKDYFGNEHPTHIGYITGYPDGTVQAEGSITREEMATVLYRVIQQSYDVPKMVTGTIFTDVSAERWSAQAVEYLSEQQVLQGYPDGTFAPENAMTRAEFSAMISRWLKAETPDVITEFPDVQAENWAYNFIYALSGLGFVQGYEDGTFRPDETISRAEVMTVMNKILGRAASEEYIKARNFNPYLDLEKDQWYYTDVIEATVTHKYVLEDKIEVEWILDEEN